MNESRRGGPVIAVDGPSGSGKSTVSRALARRLRLRYLDTGAMYRAVTWAALEAGLPLDDPARLADLAATAPVEIGTDPDRPTVTVGGRDVAVDIRGAAVTGAVSVVAAVPAVRTALVGRQRLLIGDGGIVVEGRDIGTAVAPDAELKVFLTADATARAARRASETAADPTATRADLDRRDRLDASRSSSPLVRAADAVVVDSTRMSVDEVVATVLAHLGAQPTGGPR